MDERPDLERYVEEESADRLRRLARFVGWPAWLRLVAVVGCATLLILPAAGLILLLADRGPASERRVAYVSLGLTALVVYGMGVWVAVRPGRAMRYFVRQSAAYPTSAPGYTTWKGDERRPR